MTFAVFQCVLGISVVHGQSMEPTFVEKDIVLFNRLSHADYGDIVIAKSEYFDAYIIKRVIGLPGDTIEIVDGVTYRNGEALTETYINSDETDFEAVTVPDGCYFLMGDNRPHSTDSRSSIVSFVAQEDVIGVVFH